MRFEIRERVIITLALLLVLVHVPAGWYQYSLQQQDLQNQQRLRMQQLAGSLAGQWHPLDGARAQRQLEQLARRHHLSYLYISDGRHLYETGRSNLLEHLSVSIDEVAGITRLTLAMAPAGRETLARFGKQLLLESAARIAVICLALYLVLTRLVTRPLNKVRGTMRDLRQNLIDEFPHESENDYVKITHHFHSLHKLQQRTQEQFNFRIGNAQSELVKTKKALEKQKEKWHALKSRYQDSAHVDTLTGLRNRCAFDLYLQDCQKSLDPSSGLSIAIVQLDQIKKINDELGLIAGNHFIVQAANQLHKCKKSKQRFFRISGCKFALVMEYSDKDKAYLQMEYMRNKMENKPIRLRHQAYPATISVGLVTYPNTFNIDTTDELYKCAEVALHYSKEHGGNLCTQFEYMMRSIKPQNRKQTPVTE